MRSVLLAGPSGSDPAGKRAVYDAVRTALPDNDVVDVARSGSGRTLLGAARRSAGVVVAGTSLTPTRGRAPAGRRSVGESARSVAAMAMLSSAARRPLAVVGLSTGRLDGPLTRMWSGRAVRRPDLLLLGDEDSAGHLAAAGAPLPLRIAADPAWAVLPTPPGPAPAGDTVVVVVDGRLDARLEADLAAGLEAVARAGHPVRLMPWAASGTGDGAMSWRLARRIRAASSVPVEVETVPARLPEAAERMAGARLVLALRYRALHAAAAAGVPAAAVAVESRIEALATRLGQAVVRPGELARALPCLVSRTDPAGAAAADLVSEEVGRARAGLSLMRLVLDPTEVGADEVNCLPLVPVPWL